MKPTGAAIALMLIPALASLAHAQALPKHSHAMSRAGYYSVKMSYVTPPAGSPLSRLAITTLAVWTREQAHDFIEESRQDLAGGRPSIPYDYEMTPFHTRYVAPRLFSIVMLLDQYTGGAHPLTARATFNFGIVKGRAKCIALADFFEPSSSYRKQVQSLLLSKLHHDERASFINEVTAFSSEQLNCFVVEHDGLRFYFDPYAVGPYAAGPIEVKLTAKELGPSFRRRLTE